MQFKAIYFDIDETLYPIGARIVDTYIRRMEQFIDERFAAGQLGGERPHRENLFTKYGTTQKGLSFEYGVDRYDFMNYVNDFKIDGLLTADEAVRAMILRIPMARYILTNADRFHATRVLKALNLSDCFDGMIDSIDVFPDVKPSSKAFEYALKITNQPDPARCIFVDDKHDNVTAAHEMGFFSIQVGSKQLSPVADARIDQLIDLPKLGIYQEIADEARI